MGIEEDRIDLMGSDYERKLYDLKKGYVHKYLVHAASKGWQFKDRHPAPGQGSYIERLPDGKCRRWNNQFLGDDSYTLV